MTLKQAVENTTGARFKCGNSLIPRCSINGRVNEGDGESADVTRLTSRSASCVATSGIIRVETRKKRVFAWWNNCNLIDSRTSCRESSCISPHKEEHTAGSCWEFSFNTAQIKKTPKLWCYWRLRCVCVCVFRVNMLKRVGRWERVEITVRKNKHKIFCGKQVACGAKMIPRGEF